MRSMYRGFLSLFGLLKPAKIGKKFITMYGRVNTWITGGWANLKKDIDRCAKKGVDGYLIEMAGWARSDAWTGAWLSETDEAYKRALKRCRKKGIWLMVSIVNDNMGRGKYGDKGPSLQRVTEQAHVLCAIVKRNGPKNVIVQPVAATQTSAGVQFENHCMEQLGDKFIMVYNGSSGHPVDIPSGYQYRAHHPFKVNEDCPADAIVISDTGMIIGQLGEGLDGPGKPGMLKAWTKRIRDQGCPVAGYYAFKYAGHDKAAIDAMGKKGK